VLEDTIQKEKNNRDYGVELHISKNLYFFVEIRKNIYYGFYFNGNIDKSLVDILDRIEIEWEEPYWKYPNSRLNFEEFNSNVLELINKDRLKYSVSNIAKEIIFLIENFKQGE